MPRPRGAAGRSGRPAQHTSSSRSSSRSGARASAGPRAAAPRRVSALEAALEASAATPSPEPTPFAQLGLEPRLVTALARQGLVNAFEIQARVLPDGLAGRSLLGRARTGSGKTIGFGLPLLTRVAASRGTRRPMPRQPRGLVLVPTRELASQVTEVLETLGRALDLRVTAVYGGASLGRQSAAMRRGVDIVVATPGRLTDLIERQECSLDAVEITVLDEADHLCDLGFFPAITKLLDMTPADGQRFLFSATLDADVEKLASRYLTDPAVHAVPEEAPTGQVEHQIVQVRAEDKLAMTAQLAESAPRTLVFVRTKHGADRLARQLTRAGVEALPIHGDLRQSARERALAAFASSRSPVLVATDVAARGIHVDAVDRVVHFDAPQDAKTYLHRSGRTGRAGAEGIVVSFAPGDGVREVQRMHVQAGVTSTLVVAEITREMPAVSAAPVDSSDRADRYPSRRDSSRGPSQHAAPRRHQSSAAAHSASARPGGRRRVA